MILLNFISFLLTFQITLDNLPIEQASIEGFEFGMSTGQIFEKLGTPNIIDTLIDEIGDGLEFQQLRYDGLTLSVKNGVIEDYDLRSEKYQLKFNSLKIGDPRSKVVSLFPNSYKNRWKSGQNTEIIDVTINNADYYLKIVFNDDRITNIFTWTPS